MENKERQTSSGDIREMTLQVRSRDLWFRQDKMQLVRDHKILSTIRFGDRRLGTADPKGGYGKGDVVLLKIQKEDGGFDDWTTKIVISGLHLKKYRELTEEEFAASAVTPMELAEYYGAINPEEEITLIDFKYMDSAGSAGDLVEWEALKVARLPEANPSEFGAGDYTVPLIEHDYPAKTPVMWNAAYEAFGIEDRNIMLVGDPTASKEVLDVFRRDPRYRGGGAGVGFKDTAIEYLDELDSLAEAIGSVNFILKTPEGKLRGYNTDGIGYATALEKLTGPLAGKKALILGGGGTANAIGFALAQAGVELTILNRSVEKAVSLAARVNSFLGEKAAVGGGEQRIAQSAPGSDVIINTSTKGATGRLESYSGLASAVESDPDSVSRNLEQSLTVLRSLKKGAIVSDINLVAGKTPLLSQAESLGLETLDGIPMVINQGVEAFWLLYGNTLVSKGVTKQDVAEVMTKAAFGQ